jgi:hypothetical protein
VAAIFFTIVYFETFHAASIIYPLNGIKIASLAVLLVLIVIFVINPIAPAKIQLYFL